MSALKDILQDIDEDVDRCVEEIHGLHQETLSDEDSGAIIDTMQKIEDKLSNLLAEYGVEIGDERID